MIKIISIIFISILMLQPYCHAEIIFEDDFDDWTTGLSIYDGGPDPPSPWVNWSLTGVVLPATCNSVARPYVGGIGVNATGGVGGSKALEMPRCSSVTNNYYGTPRLIISDIGSYDDLYFRFYMKFDNGFDKAISEGYKLINRIELSNGDTWYPSLHGSTISTSSLAVTGPGDFGGWYTLASHTTFYDDHQWHCIEIRILLRSTSTGVVQCWVDGVQTANLTSMQTSESETTFQALQFSLGNFSDSAWYQSTWLSQWFDELVIADEYIGPLSGSSSGVAPWTGCGIQ